MGKGRRVVEYKGTAPGKQQGRGPRLWAYGYADLARLLVTTEQALRARVARGWNPGDLEIICREWATARGLVVALALVLAAAAGCAAPDETTVDVLGTGGTRAELGVGGAASGVGGMAAPSGAGGAPAPGTGGAGVAGARGGGGGAGVGGALAGVGGAVAGTGGAFVAGTGGTPAATGTGGSAPLPECNGTGQPDSASLCGYVAANGFQWVYMFKDGLRCATCFSSPGVQQVTECLDSIDNPAELCVASCSSCTY